MERSDGSTCACGGKPVKGRRCRICLNRDHAAQQAARRLSKLKQCACGALIQATSSICRRCNMSGIGAATHKPMPPEHTPPPVVFTRLRGPGGEMDAMLSGGGPPAPKKVVGFKTKS